MGLKTKSTFPYYLKASGSLPSLDKDIKNSARASSGACYRRLPMIISLLLCIWSFTLYRKATMPGCGTTENSSGVDENTLRRTLQQAAGFLGTDPGTVMGFMGGLGKSVGVGSALTMTIFCSPKSYNLAEPHLDEQRRALMSWLRLTPTPKIVLLGDDPTFPEIAKEFKGLVTVDPMIDYNFRGVPQFHSMLARAQAADTDLSMIINGDIILLNDLMPAIERVSMNFDDWVLTAARWDLGEYFPFKFETAEAKDPAMAAEFDKKIQKFVRNNGSLHTYGGVDFWLWNNSPVPLFSDAMPPFTFGRSKYDNWLTHEVIAAGLREMVDASDSVMSIHVAHSYDHVATLMNGTLGSVANGKNFWSMRKKSSWEMFNNIHLAEEHGSYTNQMGTALHVPWKLTTCQEPMVKNICLQKRHRPANCSCEYSSTVLNTQSDPKLDEVTNSYTCGKVSVDRKVEYEINAIPNENTKAGLPHTMEQLLPQIAKEVDDQKVVILVAVTYGYAEMLMNFVCRLRLLGLAENLVVAALDEDLYKFAFTQGLATYYEMASDNLKTMDSADCAFGSQCFRQFTKLKSRAVLRVLKAGYSVLWTDVDIVWYSDPLPHLMSYGPNTFPIQSNEPNASLPGTGIRRINSGFYFAWSNKKTIEAFEAITEHASHTKLSEQPSFYDVLCGDNGERLIKGREECKWTNGLRTVFLDRALYPNGAVHDLWNQKDVTAACKKKKCVILHNNWISGKDEKTNRMVANGYWHYDVERRMCIHDWHSKLSGLYKTKQVVEETSNETTAAAATK